MTEKYYFDTSIWLDFFEDRDEPNLHKSKWVHTLIAKIVGENKNIVYSNVVIDELKELGYTEYELENLFEPLKPILIYAESTNKQHGKAKDLAQKQGVPLLDALHALIARDNKALMVTRDTHFKKLSDVTKPEKPEEIT